MTAKTTHYPRPVLDENGNDFPCCNFSLLVESRENERDTLVFDISAALECNGIQDMLNRGLAKTYVLVECGRTSYRRAFEIPATNTLELQISRGDIANNLTLQGIIAATEDIEKYELPEFNQAYFKNMHFRLRKSDMLAKSSSWIVELDTALEKDMAGIVWITKDSNIDEPQIRFPAATDEGETDSQHICVLLPENEFEIYGNLRAKRYLRNGAERFLQCSIVLPAITEAISLLRHDEELGDESRYRGTVWADSIYAALRKIGIDDLMSSMASSYELANKILGNVMKDSLNNLHERLDELATIESWD